MGRKGMSKIIINVLLIAFSLIAIGVVWVVIQNILSEKVDNISLDHVLVDLKIKQVEVDGGINISIKRNIGEGNLVGIKFVVSDGINSEVFEKNTTLKELEEEIFDLNHSGSLTKISIAPIFKLESGRKSVGNIVDDYDLEAGEECLIDCSCAVDICAGAICSDGCEGECEGVKQPDCSGKECGDDGCGGSCGTCDNNYFCEDGACVFDIYNMEGLVSWWKFEGDANDEVGENHGTIYGADCNVPGKYGKGCALDGTNDYIVVNYGNGLNPSTISYTYSLWVKWDSSLGNPNPMFLSQSIAPNRMYIGISNSKWGMGIDTSSYSSPASSIIVDNDWHMITVILNGANAKMYVDGNDISYTKSYSSYTFNQNLYLGVYRAEKDYDFAGFIDEVRVWNRSLSEEEINILYNLN